MTRLAMDAALRVDLGRNARRFAEETFAKERVLARLEASFLG
jgi:hypothetical protein